MLIGYFYILQYAICRSGLMIRKVPYLCIVPLNVRQRRNHPERWLRTSPNPILSGQIHGR